MPRLGDVLEARDYERRERSMVGVYGMTARRHPDVGVTEPV